MRYTETDMVLARAFKALAHPARLAIVRALLEEEGCCCGEIVRRLPLAQSTVSEHLKVLKDAGIVTGVIEGPRACYAIERDALKAMMAALGGLTLTACGSRAAAALRHEPVRGEELT